MKMTPSLVSLVTVLILLLVVLASHAQADTGSVRVYIGTYTAKTSKGIYLANLDPATGSLSVPTLAGEMPNPSFVALSPNGRFLYACGEFGTDEGSNITAFSVAPDGNLTLLNHQPLPGGPCYVTVDSTGTNVLAACYGNGLIANFKVAADGKLATNPWTEQHPGANTKTPPHAHCIDPDPANRFILCNDLGLDRVYVYRFDAAKGLLTPNEPPFASLKVGSGPRHLTYSADGKFVYTINELASTLTAFTYDAEHGVLHETQTVSTLPGDFAGKSYCAEVVLHPNGKYLYGSNRGHDSIVQFAIDPQTGKVTVVGHTPTGGKNPRGFGIDPTGNWLIVGNQNSDNLLEFRIDPATGQLKSTSTTFTLGSPVCIKFANPPTR